MSWGSEAIAYIRYLSKDENMSDEDSEQDDEYDKDDNEKQ